jgi:hypothetical protein
MYSPNIRENMTFDQALVQLRSARQNRFNEISKKVDGQLGLNADTRDAIGDWSDGAENSLMTYIPPNGHTYDDIRYSASVKGLMARQKQTIAFGVKEGGPDSMYRFKIKADIADVRRTLEANGVQYRTLIPLSKQTEVVIFDPETKLTENVGKVIEHYGAEQAKQFRGNGEYIGGDTRAEGAKKFREVIAEYESTHSRRYQGTFRRSVSDRWSAGAEEVGRNKVSTTLTYYGEFIKGRKLEGRLEFQGLNVSIETDAGSTRSGVDKEGKPWAVTMTYPYGYIRMTEGVDGDHVDCFVGPNPNATHAYIINTNDPTVNKFDEQKVMLGWDTPETALAAFIENYSSIAFFRSIEAMSMDEFKKKVLATKDEAIPVTAAKIGKDATTSGISTGTGLNAYNLESDGKKKKKKPVVLDTNVAKDFSSDEARDATGKWTAGSGSELWKQPKAEFVGTFEREFPGKTGSEVFTPEEEERYLAYRSRDRQWQASTLRAVSEGKLEPEQAYKQGLDRDSGIEFKPLPSVLYHVTTAASNVEADGLKTRQELGQFDGHGLGGGTSDTVSFTTDPKIAAGIESSMLEARKVARGETTVADMMASAERGDGADHPWVSDLNRYHGKAIDDMIRGVKTESEIFGHTRDEMPGWTPKADAYHWTGGDKLERYNQWERPATEAEKRDTAFQFFKGWSLFRENAGGPLDPLFFGSDYKALGETPVSEIKTLKFSPIPNAKGYQVSSLGEWRINSGGAVRISKAANHMLWLTFSGKAVKLDRPIAKYAEDEARDAGGKWTSSGAEVTPKDKPISLVFSGTLNPPHMGHVSGLQDAVKHLEDQGYNVAHVIVAPSPSRLVSVKLGDKAYPLPERVELARLTFAGVKNVEVTGEPAVAAEAVEGKIRRTDTADWVKNKYPDTTVVSVTGEGDAPGANPPKAPAVYAGDKGSKHEGYYYQVVSRDEGAGAGYSSTKIRAAIREGKSVPAGMMHPDAEKYLSTMLARHPEIQKIVRFLHGLEKEFDPAQPRDETGKWTAGGEAKPNDFFDPRPQRPISAGPHHWLNQPAVVQATEDQRFSTMPAWKDGYDRKLTVNGGQWKYERLGSFGQHSPTEPPPPTQSPTHASPWREDSESETKIVIQKPTEAEAKLASSTPVERDQHLSTSAIDSKYNLGVGGTTSGKMKITFPDGTLANFKPSI